MNPPRRMPPQVRRCAAVTIKDVAAALQAMHTKGLCHLDVKPGNILISADGSYKLADLGNATALTTPQSDLSFANSSPRNVANRHLASCAPVVQEGGFAFRRAATLASKKSRKALESLPPLRARAMRAAARSAMPSRQRNP